MSPINFNFVMIYIIHKMLALLKNHLNFLKDNIFECFFKKYNIDRLNRFLSFLKIYIFSYHIIMESLSLEENNRIKYIRNLFRRKKN